MIHHGGSAEVAFNRETVEGLLGGGGFFWLDLDQPEPDDFEILREVFGVHPLAVEDSETFDQRAKFEEYDDSGVGTEVLTLVLRLAFFKRRRWF